MNKAHLIILENGFPAEHCILNLTKCQLLQGQIFHLIKDRNSAFKQSYDYYSEKLMESASAIKRSLS